MLVTVHDPDDESAYLPPLERAGYELRVREVGHRMLRTPELDVQIHVWAAGSEDEHRHLVFRDWLRAHPADRATYEQTKRELAGRFREMNHYAQAKTEAIEEILERARRPPRDSPDAEDLELRRSALDDGVGDFDLGSGHEGDEDLAG